MSAWRFFAPLVALALCWPTRALGECAASAPLPAMIDPALQASDHQPPTIKAISAPTIQRGSRAEGCGDTSCWTLGFILISVVAQDDVTPVERLGYRYTLTSGELPRGFVLPDVPVEPEWASPQLLRIDWVDGASDTQEPIDFTVNITAVDAAGNESPPQSLIVHDPGTPPPSGCQLSSGSRETCGRLLLAGLMIVLAALRRRRPA